jgi:tRNA/rRNA methyltransferase
MSETALANIRIVLIEPAGALNVGSIARVMKNMGLQKLILVNPHCDPLGEEARQMAVHGSDLLEAASQVTTLPEALQGCQRAIATTARDRALDTVLESPRMGLPWLLEGSRDAQTASGSALIFGPEDRGLSNTELSYAQRFVRIPSSPHYSALNLAQAVAVCCYELYLAAGEMAEFGQNQAIAAMTWPERSPLLLPSNDANLAELDVLARYYNHLESLLLKIGYLYPHTAASRMEKLRRLLNRAYPSPTEVALLRGILSQVEWFLQKQQQSEGNIASDIASDIAPRLVKDSVQSDHSQPDR